MAITKETLKSAIDELEEQDLPMVYQLIHAIKLHPGNPAGQRMASALQRMADRNALADIADPIAWQREIREDRPLPGRE